MSLFKLAALLAGACIAAGLAVTARALIPRPHTPVPPRIATVPGRSLRAHIGRTAAHAAISAAAGLVIAVITGWWVAILALPIAAIGLPQLFRREASAHQTERLEAMAEWTRALSGIMTGAAVGLPEAITATVSSAPKAIAHDVALLSSRLTARWSPEDALWALADDLNDPTGDLIAATLLLGARERGSRLGNVLKALAKTVADDVTVRRRVESDRSSPRTVARVLTVFCVGGFAAFVLLTDAADRYGTFIGQLVLLILLSAFGGCLYWLHHISTGKPAPRFLIRPTEPTPTTATSPTHTSTTAGAAS